jgi:acyl carrier protein
MEDVKDKIKALIVDIMAQSDLPEKTITDTSLIVKDLGFTSLDVAELIANLEMELGIDPFSNGVSLLDVRSFGDICEVYSKSLGR